MYQRILVPIDGSNTSTLGLREALRLAAAGEGRLRLIHVVDELVIAQNFDGYVNSADLLETVRDSGRKTLQQALALAGKAGVEAETAMFESIGERVADVIVRDAKKWKADLIVMGTHGRRGIGRVVLGSDAEAVLRTTPVPVLMVRAPESQKSKK